MTVLLTSELMGQINVSNAIEKVTLDEVKKYEADLLDYFKALPPQALQEKYLYAATKFSEVGKFNHSRYLLAKGVNLSNPSLTYLNTYLSLLDEDNKDKVIIALYEKYILKNESFHSQEYDTLAEVSLLYLRASKKIDSEIENKKIREALKLPYFFKQLKWSNSITFANKKDYKNSLNELRTLNPLGEEDAVFLAYLQKKNSMLPRFCMKMEAFEEVKLRSSYPKTCEVLISNSNADIETRIITSNELIEHSPLWEVLK